MFVKKSENRGDFMFICSLRSVVFALAFVFMKSLVHYSSIGLTIISTRV